MECFFLIFSQICWPCAMMGCTFGPRIASSILMRSLTVSWASPRMEKKNEMMIHVMMHKYVRYKIPTVFDGVTASTESMSKSLIEIGISKGFEL